MFINQKQLFELKYNPDSRFYDLPMCGIFIEKNGEIFESNNFSKFDGNTVLLMLFSDFLNRRLSDNKWRIYFADDTSVIVRHDGKGFQFQGLYLTDND